ncbi:hypothetical protein AC249_AIPGENE24561 [Exaiptasia diaphana]|nr:hypothetical protein AC249_AIPGENE24561 [Exaiptasia diaphana]
MASSAPSSPANSGEPASLDAVMVLLEEISKANKNLIEENKKLTENVEKSDRNSRMALQDITSKLQKIETPTAENRRCRRRRSAKERRGKVSPQCRRTTKKEYKTLLKKDDFAGFNLEESFDSESNTEIVDRVVAQLRHKFSGEDKVPWSRDDIDTVLQRYWLSLYEKEKKLANNKYDDHKKACRKNGRKTDVSIPKL